MIISHQHRYLFVELPHTASTAIRRELLANYDGSSILHRHATYIDFERIASPDERSYFVFSCIRNPLDVAVTLYHRLRGTNLHSLEKRRGGRDFLRHGPRASAEGDQHGFAVRAAVRHDCVVVIDPAADLHRLAGLEDSRIHGCHTGCGA